MSEKQILAATISLEHVERLNSKLSKLVPLESEVMSLWGQDWLPKYMRRSGLTFSWAWAHEFTVAELIAIMSIATDTSDSMLAALKGSDSTGSLLDWADRFEADDAPIRVKRRRVVFALFLLQALLRSMHAIGLHSLSIHELVQQGLSGDSVALRRAVAVDPTILAMPSVASFIAEKALKGARRELAQIHLAAAKGPNKKLEPYRQLRYMERVIAEGKVIEAYGREAVFQLFTDRLRLYDSRGKDPFKALFTLFARWRESATT